ncbi:DUF4190 domain-containing protein [Kitasatospora sp. NPDC090308]|uniref:DUF4190 domain-containing protein n=1 Tax=Kitasatospora sp. NPDC090308 TaxID=3364082 RepID=UPI0037FF4220
MPLDQEGTGKDGPADARADTRDGAPAAPPALSLEKPAAVAAEAAEAGPGPGPGAQVEAEAGAGPTAEAQRSVPAVSFAKRDTAEPVADAVPVAEPTADAAAAPVAPQPVNPWAMPAPGAAPEAAAAAPAPVPSPAPVPAANPWAAPAPGATAPAAGAAETGAAGPAANPWAPAPDGRQPWGSGAFPPPQGPYPGPGPYPGQVLGQVPGQVPGQFGAPGYPAFPQQRSLYTNGLAIASLVVSFLCFFGTAAVIMGPIALRQIKRTGERGRGLAVSAIVIGSIWAVLFAVVLVANALDPASGQDDGDGRPTSTRNGSAVVPAASALRLEVGECFDLVGTLVTKRIDCAQPHKGEVFWTGIPVETGDYPFTSVLEDEAEKGCSDHVDQYVMDTWTLGDSLDYRYVYPDRNSWDAVGGRRLVCFFTDSEPLTAPLRKDQTTLTSDQLHLLLATNQFDRAWAEAPNEDLDVADDPAAFRTWADGLAAAADKQAALLAGAQWTTADRKTVDRLVGESREAARHFRAAGKLTGAEDVERELTAGYQHLGDDLILDLRRGLGLATHDQEPAKHPSNQAV